MRIPLPFQVSAEMPLASKYTCTTVPVEKTCTTVPVVVSISALASRTSTPVIRLISCRSAVGGVVEQLAVKVLHLSGPFRGLGKGPLGRRQGPVQGDDQRLVTQDHGHRLGRVAGSLLLESDGRLGDLLRHGQIGLVHPVPPWCLRPAGVTASEKKADVVEHPEAFDHVGLLVNEPPGPAGLPFT